MTTYRIQLRAEFTVADLIAKLDYLQSLGITTIYGSPILTATPGSNHNYDVTNPEELNPAVTTEAEWMELHAELRRRGMTYMQDIVPNHTALNPHNVWFKTVVQDGRKGKYAHHFDIDWDHPELSDRMMLPVLGATTEEAETSGDVEYYRHGVRTYDRYWEGPDADREAPPAGELGVLPVHWRDTERWINYRRFFTVNELIGMRTEDERVYEDMHARTFLDVREGRIQHIRIDHIDGLLDPTGYMRRLRESVGPDVGIWVEKILEPGERLPEEWPVRGTSGYDFLAEVNRLLTDEASNNLFSSLYEELTGEHLPDYHELVFRNKLMLVRDHFGGELANLVRRWSPLLPEELHEGLDDTLAHWLAAFPVYRIYPSEGKLGERDLAVCLEATKAVSEYAPEHARGVLAFVNWLAGRDFEGKNLEMLQRSQQLSGPLMAKGVEDTTFYQFWRQAHLNEVGGSAAPEDRVPVRDFHEFILARPKTTMNATATHDTKRGEDSRAFLQALSFYPQEWRAYTELAFERLNTEGLRPRDVYFLLQTVVAAFPLHRPPQEIDLRERLHAYLEKGLREGKEVTNYAEPNTDYEAKMKALSDRLLDDDTLRPALEELLRTIWPQARHNSFAQTVLKCTVPGIPDVYQGTEGWDLSLVDPDNRRPVDYAARRQWLEGRGEDDYHPAHKARLLRDLLHLRRDNADFFAKADYEPLVEGDGVLAFRRTHAGKTLEVRIAKRARTRVQSSGKLPAVVEKMGLGAWFG